MSRPKTSKGLPVVVVDERPGPVNVIRFERLENTRKGSDPMKENLP